MTSAHDQWSIDRSRSFAAAMLNTDKLREWMTADDMTIPDESTWMLINGALGIAHSRITDLLALIDRQAAEITDLKARVDA